MGMGRRKGSLNSETVVRMQIRRIVIDSLRKEIDPIMSALIKKAKEGDVAAIKEALERGAGKEANSLFVTPEDPLTAVLKDIQSRSKSIVTDKE